MDTKQHPRAHGHQVEHGTRVLRLFLFGGWHKAGKCARNGSQHGDAFSSSSSSFFRTVCQARVQFAREGLDNLLLEREWVTGQPDHLDLAGLFELDQRREGLLHDDLSL